MAASWGGASEDGCQISQVARGKLEVTSIATVPLRSKATPTSKTKLLQTVGQLTPIPGVTAGSR